MDTTIQQLDTKSICDNYGNYYGVKAPSNFEIMEKLNELINIVNYLLKEKETKKSPME